MDKDKEKNKDEEKSPDEKKQQNSPDQKDQKDEKDMTLAKRSGQRHALLFNRKKSIPPSGKET